MVLTKVCFVSDIYKKCFINSQRFGYDFDQMLEVMTRERLDQSCYDSSGRRESPKL